MGTSERGFQLGILPERKIDRRALATSYTIMVVLMLLLVNLSLIFPDRLTLKQYRVTELIPVPALRPEPLPIKKPLKLKTKLVEPVPVFEQPKAGCSARGSCAQTGAGPGPEGGDESICSA